MEIFWRVEALQHLDDIFEFIARDNPPKAFDVREHLYFYAEKQLLATDEPSTMRGRPGKVKGTRELVVSDYPNYIIVYRIVEDTRIEILAVRHGKRLWPKSF